jgi:two-component system cell cycle response regulator
MALSHCPRIAPAPSDSALRSSREALLGLLFQETDRVQRMKTPLSLVLVGLDELPPSDSRSVVDLSEQVALELSRRIAELLRSYDQIGRIAKNKFLLLLPGCTEEDARALADRIRNAVFHEALLCEGNPIQLNASFGITASRGRSPLVVLQQAETALQHARQVGPGSTQIYEDGFLASPIFGQECPTCGRDPA